VGEAVNPAQKLLRWFDTEHLSDELATVVEPFGLVAKAVADRTVGTEGTTAVRKLIEAKDCAVRDYIQGKEQRG
jgi:hypothetical protein